MTRFSKSLLLSTLLCVGSLQFSPPVSAQANSNRALMDRIDRLERDLMTMQRQNARGVGNTNMEALGGDDADADPQVMGTVEGDIQQQITLLQEEMRSLRGQLEQSEFEARKNADALQRLQKDVEFRLNALEQAPAAGITTYPSEETDVAPAANNLSNEPLEIKKVGSSRKVAVQQVEEAVPASEPAEEPEPEATPEPIDTTTEAVTVEKEPAEKSAKPSKPTTAGDGTLTTTPKDEDPREHYNRAFRLLNQTRYDEAGKAFEQFTKKYPDDPLIGNAYYWLGETRYIQRDYVKAADSFRQGFEVLPSGPKAPDNLLKLSMTLRALNRNDEACVVLGQIKVKFKDSSTSLLDKVEQERTRIGCK